VADANRKCNRVSIRRLVLQTVRYWGIRYSTTDRGYGYGTFDEGRGDEAPQRPPALDDDIYDTSYMYNCRHAKGFLLKMKKSPITNMIMATNCQTIMVDE
jgi:hypothetical protein